MAAVLTVNSSMSPGQKPSETANPPDRAKDGSALGDGGRPVWKAPHSPHVDAAQPYLPGHNAPQNDTLLLPAPVCICLGHTNSIFIITNPDVLLCGFVCLVETWFQAAQASLKLVEADTEFLILSLLLFVCGCFVFCFLGFLFVLLLFFKIGSHCTAPAGLELAT